MAAEEPNSKGLMQWSCRVEAKDGTRFEDAVGVTPDVRSIRTAAAEPIRTDGIHTTQQWTAWPAAWPYIHTYVVGAWLGRFTHHVRFNVAPNDKLYCREISASALKGPYYYCSFIIASDLYWHDVFAKRSPLSRVPLWSHFGLLDRHLTATLAQSRFIEMGKRWRWMYISSKSWI